MLYYFYVENVRSLQFQIRTNCIYYKQFIFSNFDVFFLLFCYCNLLYMVFTMTTLESYNLSNLLD